MQFISGILMRKTLFSFPSLSFPYYKISLSTAIGRVKNFGKGSHSETGKYIYHYRFVINLFYNRILPMDEIKFQTF